MRAESETEAADVLGALVGAQKLHTSQPAEASFALLLNLLQIINSSSHNALGNVEL